MPAVLRLNRPEVEERLSRAADYLGIGGGFDGFYAFALDLNDRMGIPANLAEMGVDDTRLDELVAMALRDPSCGGNPVALTQENVRALFRECLAV